MRELKFEMNLFIMRFIPRTINRFQTERIMNLEKKYNPLFCRALSRMFYEWAIREKRR